MKVLVTGGCKNGKSTYAENLAVALSEGRMPRYYIATMIPHDDEDEARIKRHRESRKEKGFQTLEVGSQIGDMAGHVPRRGSYLLDSTTALLANEMFGEGASAWTNVEDKLITPIQKLADSVEHLIVVSDYIYSEAALYGQETRAYMKNLAAVDRALAKQFDLVIELCAGMVVYHKGRPEEECANVGQKPKKYPFVKKPESRAAKGLIMSLSMFSRIPVPFVWEEEAMPYVLRFFPIVGVLIGGLWYGGIRLFLALPIPDLLQGALFALLLPWLSGFLHMDGYMDTADAICSRADPEKKKSILKDPHTGAFAVIAFGIYLLLSFAAGVGVMEALIEASYPAVTFLMIPVVSRCLSGAFLLKGRLMSPQGYAAAYQKCAGKRDYMIFPVILLFAVAAGFFFGGLKAGAVLTAQAVAGVLAGWYASRQLGGVNGDVSGFMITVSELCAILLLSAAG